MNLQELVDVRVRLGRYADDLLGRLPRPRGDARTVVVNSDPIRLLLIGAGTGVGFGVTSRADAIDQHLADLLASRTGRGVIVDNRTEGSVRLRTVESTMGSVGAHTFDVVILFLPYGEAPESLRRSTWTRNIRHIAHLVTSTSDAHLVIGGYPDMVGNHPMGLIARPLCKRLNRMVAAETATLPGTSFTEPGRMDMRDFEAGRLGSDWYRTAAERFVEVIVHERFGLPLAS